MKILAVFLLTYLGVALGRFPKLALDRTGIALLGALAMILLGGITPTEALEAVPMATLLLLYGLIGQMGGLSFRAFLLWCAPPSLAGLLVTYGLLLLLFRSQFRIAAVWTPLEPDTAWPVLNMWQSAKGLVAVIVVMALLLLDFPRELSVLSVAGALLLSRRMHTRSILGLVDGHLIALFCGLFIVVRGINQTGFPAQAIAWLSAHGGSLDNPYRLSLVSVLLSNLVSNVPATVLLIPHLPGDQPHLWYTLSLATTYAGNLFTIGSLANLIVIEQARLSGIRISFRDYARVGLVVTSANLALLALWIRLQALV
jgi:Na+/H+ antiporter NhaD/arsenite permease-like protein